MIIRSITAQIVSTKPTMRLINIPARTIVAPHSVNRRMISIYLLSLATLAIILTASVQQNDAASVGKYKSSRDRGCYYMLQHFKNGEQIKTDEPCLNCTCENSMLMCYLRVCPYVKPVGDRCIIERVPGECCPKITCSDVGPNLDNVEQELEPGTVAPIAAPTTTQTPTTTPSTTTITTATSETPASASNGHEITFTNASEVQSGAGGCMLNNNYYHEGAQMPSDPSKPCEVCYCIQNSSACVMQDCALNVGGCTPIYQAGGCCPTRYNCSAVNAFTTPRPGFKTPDSTGRRRFWESSSVSKLLSLPTPQDQITSISSTTMKPIAFPDFGRTTKLPPAGCKAANSSRTYMDGERIPSKNRCEHCYCMRNEIVCAVQECRPPCEGCVPIIDADDQCCPKRYECAAPTQRVPTDNLIDAQEMTTIATSNISILPENVDASTSISSTIAPESSTIGDKVIEGANVVETKLDFSLSTAAPALVGDGSSSPLNQGVSEEKPKPDVSVMTTRQTKPPLKPISPKLSVNDDDNSNEMGLEQDSSKLAKTEAHENSSSATNVDGFNLQGEREQDNDLVKSTGRVVAQEGAQPTGGNRDTNEPVPATLTSTIAPTRVSEVSQTTSAPVAEPTSKPETISDVTGGIDQDKKVRPPVVASTIPGEGSCRYNGRMYQNGQEVKSKDNCMEICMCINSVVYCDEVDCPKGPENQDKCQRVLAEGECCPRFICEESTNSTTAITDQPSTMSPDKSSIASQATSSESSAPAEVTPSVEPTTPVPTVVTDHVVTELTNITPDNQDLRGPETTFSEKSSSEATTLDASSVDPVQEFGTTDSLATTAAAILSSSFSTNSDNSVTQGSVAITTVSPALVDNTSSQTPLPTEAAGSTESVNRFDETSSTSNIASSESSSPTFATLSTETPVSMPNSDKNLDASETPATTSKSPTMNPVSFVDQSTQVVTSSVSPVGENFDVKTDKLPDVIASSSASPELEVITSTTQSPSTLPAEPAASESSSFASENPTAVPSTPSSESTTKPESRESEQDLGSTVASTVFADQVSSTEVPSPVVGSSDSPVKSDAQPDINEINLAGATSEVPPTTTTTTAASTLLEAVSSDPSLSSSSRSEQETPEVKVESTPSVDTTMAPASSVETTPAPVSSVETTPALTSGVETTPVPASSFEPSTQAAAVAESVTSVSTSEPSSSSASDTALPVSETSVINEIERLSEGPSSSAPEEKVASNPEASPTTGAPNFMSGSSTFSIVSIPESTTILEVVPSSRGENTPLDEVINPSSTVARESDQNVAVSASTLSPSSVSGLEEVVVVDQSTTTTTTTTAAPTVEVSSPVSPSESAESRDAAPITKPATVTESASPTTLYNLLVTQDSASAPTTTTSAPSSTETATIGVAVTSDPTIVITDSVPSEAATSSSASPPNDGISQPTADSASEASIAATSQSPAANSVSIVDQSSQAVTSSVGLTGESLEGKTDKLPEIVASSSASPELEVITSTTQSPSTSSAETGSSESSSFAGEYPTSEPSSPSSESTTRPESRESEQDLGSTVASTVFADQASSTEAQPSNAGPQSSDSPVQPGINEINLAGATSEVPPTTTTTTAASTLLEAVSSDPSLSSSSRSEQETPEVKVESTPSVDTTMAPVSSVETTPAPVSSVETTPVPASSFEPSTQAATVSESVTPVIASEPSSSSASDAALPVSETSVINEIERLSEGPAQTTPASQTLSSQDLNSVGASSSSPLPAVELATASPALGEGSSTQRPSELVEETLGSKSAGEITGAGGQGTSAPKDITPTTVDSVSPESASSTSLSPGLPAITVESSSISPDYNAASSSFETTSSAASTSSSVTTIAPSFASATGSEDTSSFSSAQALPDFSGANSTPASNVSELERQTEAGGTASSKTEDIQIASTSSPLSQDGNIMVSTITPPSSSNVTTTSPAEELLAVTTKSSSFIPMDVTTIIPSIRGSSASITIPWSDIINSSSSAVDQSTTSKSVASKVNGTTFETKSYVHEPTQSSVAESDYEEVSEDSGYEYEGKTYNSAQQIPRSRPCDFCFCFRGDIICLQQICPPPVPHCFETVMDGFCCPRYECPVHTVRSSPNSTSLS